MNDECVKNHVENETTFKRKKKKNAKNKECSSINIEYVTLRVRVLLQTYNRFGMCVFQHLLNSCAMIVSARVMS